MIENEGVEREVAADASPVQGLHYIRQFIQSESYLGSCREVFESKIDGVRSSLDCSVKLRPVTSGRHDFGFNQRDAHHTDSKSDQNCFFTFS